MRILIQSMTLNPKITQLLQQGGTESIEELFPVVYNELHKIAAGLFRREHRPDHTLQPTALVHEAYLRLVGGENRISWQNRAHFFGIAARSMRQILVNHAEAHNSAKRGSGRANLALDEAVGFLKTQNVGILDLNNALEKMARLDKRQSEVVELKFFGGLTIEEIAEVLNVSPVTVRRDWETAKIWLYLELK